MGRVDHNQDVGVLEGPYQRIGPWLVRNSGIAAQLDVETSKLHVANDVATAMPTRCFRRRA